jgi:hypothetical protein
MGQDESTLPSSLTVNGVPTVGEAAAANSINEYLVEKVEKLVAKIPKVQKTHQNACNLSARAPKERFLFKYPNAGRIAKTIKSLNNTGATGTDGIPVCVLKLGAEVLSSPLAHLVSMSFSSSKVPTAFKEAIVVPIHKGKSKPHKDPALYRPVAILPAMSKILDKIVTEDLADFLSKTDALHDTQWGFRPGRSCSMALATAHSSWLEAKKKKGSVVGILAFDLTAAFDLVSSEKLLPKLAKLGVRGQANDWFKNYLSGGRQAILWNNTQSDFVNVPYGVRQGGLISPLLFLALVADMPDHIGSKNMTAYADDTAVWASANNLHDLKMTLEARADAFYKYVTSCGLVMNAAKTQLLVSGTHTPADFTVMVNNNNVSPSNELELLGVRFDTNLSTKPQERRLATAVRQRASLIARLTHHLPRGPYLRQLAHGLVMGKVGYATSIFVRPRLSEDDAPHSPELRAVQIALNDVARSLSGLKRTDHVRVAELLGAAGILSLNQVATKAMALESWAAYHSNDGHNGERNLLGKTLFGNNNSLTDRQTRSVTDGKIVVPLRGENTFVSNAASIWNSNIMLRTASSRSEASAVSRTIALNVP